MKKLYIGAPVSLEALLGKKYDGERDEILEMRPCTVAPLQNCHQFAADKCSGTIYNIEKYINVCGVCLEDSEIFVKQGSVGGRSFL